MTSCIKLIIGCGLSACASAFAAVVQYDSQPMFLSAAGAVSTENFDSVAVDTPFRTASVSIGDLTLTGFGSSQDAYNLIDANPSVISGFSINGSTQVTAITAPTDTGLTVRFSQPISAFAATFISLQAPNSQLRTEILAAGSVLTPPLLASSAISFFGFTSDVSFSEVRFQNANPLWLDSFAFDDVLYSPAPAIPEASTSAMLLLGLGGLIAVTRSRKMKPRSEA